MIRLVAVSALALLLPGMLMLVLAAVILRGRGAPLPSARDLRRRRLGTHLSDTLERQSVTRVTESREPFVPTDAQLRANAVTRRIAGWELDPPQLGTCDGECVGYRGVRGIRERADGPYCLVCGRPVPSPSRA